MGNLDAKGDLLVNINININIINVDRQKVDASVTIDRAFDEKFLAYCGIK